MGAAWARHRERRVSLGGLLGLSTLFACLLVLGFVVAKAWAVSTTPYTLAQVQAHATAADCWTIISGQVYNVTPLVSTHTGGANTITPTCGRDGTTQFNSQHQGRAAILNTMNASYQIGIFVSSPGAPTTVRATAGNLEATVTWTAPASNGGSAITSYTVTSNPGGRTCSTATTTCVVTGLTGGTTYTFTATATNAVGTSAASAASPSITISAIPNPPTNVVLVRGNTSATASWTAAVANGSAVTGYTVTATPGGRTCTTTTAVTCAITGLTNGTAYTVTVIARSAAGNSAASAPSNSATPAAAPSAPTGVTAARGDASSTVSWTASVANGDPVTSYTVTSTPGSLTCSTSGVSCTVTGLTNGTSYTFRVVATNTVGSSAASAASAAVIPAAGPSVPSNVAAIAGNAQATVSWSASNGNGSTVTGYTVTSTPDSKVCSTTSALTCTVTGLTNGTSYTFRVVAISAVSQSSPSLASNAVVPAGPPVAATNVVAVRGNQQLTVTWTPAGDNGSAITGYVATATPGGASCSSASSPCTITGLTNGTAYTVVVVATNAKGSTASAASASVTPATNPGQPMNLSGVRGDTRVTLSWTAPDANGSPIVGYTVTASPSGATCQTATTSCAVTGLANGTAYTFQVVATNAVGSSIPSLSTSSLTPAGLPTRPDFVSATRADGAAAIEWVLSDPNGAEITAYLVTSSPGNQTCVTTTSTCTVTGLTNGTSYTFSVIARNAVGDSLSGVSGSVIPAGLPTVPTNVSVVRGDGEVSVSWVASNGNGVVISGYTVTANPGGLTCAINGTSCVVSGLTNGTAYTFSVVAINDVGRSASSTPSQSVTPAGLPSAPAGLLAVRGDREAVVSWSASSPNGAAVSAYTVIASPGGASCTSAETTCTVVGLINGTQYTFVVVATNEVGTSVNSTNSSAVTPAGKPTTPTAVSAVYGSQQATVSWTASDGNGEAISTYTVTSSPGGETCTSTTTSCVVGNLVNGTEYVFTVIATNAVGESNISAASLAIIPAAVPDSPTAVVAIRGDGTADVSWTAGAANGRAITSFVVTAWPGGLTCSSTSTTCTVEGLNNGWTYSFTVTAVNFVGNSAPSALSNSVVPAGVPVAPAGLVAVRGDRQAIVSWFSSYANGSPVSGYIVTAQPGAITCETIVGVDLSPTSCTFPDLQNGIAYTFSVVARNAIGTSAPSATSSPVTPAGLPAAPTSVAATRGNGSATVQWSSADGNGLSISTYVVRMVGGGQVCSVATTSCLVTGLTNGANYSFTVSAATEVGESPVSLPTIPVVPAGLPVAPTGVIAVRGDTEASVTWTSSFGNGDPVIGYTVTSSPEGLTCTAASTACTVTGLTNGVAYTFKVVATNGVGDSAASSPSLSVTPAGVPTAPRNVVGQRGNQEVSVSWSAPTSSNGASVTSYIVTSTPDSMTCTTSGLSCTVTGLTNGVQYTFTVKAFNAVGASVFSSASNAVTPAALSMPPTGVTAIRGDGEALISWNAPTSDGGSAITGYRATATPGGSDCTAVSTSCTISGLTNGVTYMITVVATNAVGDSLPSPLSASIKPAGVPSSPANVTAVRGDREVIVSWNAGASNGEPIVSFTAISTPGGFTCSAASTSCVISGLNNGTSYTFTVTAFNAVGTSSASLPSAGVIPAAVPSAVENVVAVRGSQVADVSWDAAVANGAAVTQYTVTAAPGGATCTAVTTSCQVTGLENGTAYNFVVVAVNEVGVSAQSQASNTVTPADVPTAPTAITAVRSSSAVTVSWQASAGNGSSISAYVVTATPGGATCSTVTTSCQISGLTNGTSYSFTVVATNEIGNSPESPASEPVTPAAPPTPVQTAKGVSNAPKRVTLSWARAANNGELITSYEFTWRAQGSTTWAAWKNVGTANKITITGWLKGKNYQFKIRATNAVGNKTSKNFLYKPVK